MSFKGRKTNNTKYKAAKKPIKHNNDQMIRYLELCSGDTCILRLINSCLFGLKT